MARTRRRYSNKFVRSEVQGAVVDDAAAVSEQITHWTKGGPATHTDCPRLWSKVAAKATHSAQLCQCWPPHTHATHRTKVVPAITPARCAAAWPEDILMEVLSALWFANLSPRDRRAALRSVPLVCKHWLQAWAHVFAMSAYTVSARSDLFERLHFDSLLGNHHSLERMSQTYTRQLPASKSTPTRSRFERSHQISLRYEDTGTAASSRVRTAVGGLPASLLRDAIDTFRHLEYMPELRSLVMEYRTYYETDAAPLHRVEFRVVHVDVEYQFGLHHNGREDDSMAHHPTPHWLADELGMLPTSVSRASKREDLLSVLPDLNLVSFTSSSPNPDPDDPDLLWAIGDVISMGGGAVSSSAADDGRFIRVKVLNGLDGLKGRFALVHGLLDKKTCVVDSPPSAAPIPLCLPWRRRQSFQSYAHPSVPNSVKGKAMALVINLGGEESIGNHSDGVQLREARIFSKRTSI